MPDQRLVLRSAVGVRARQPIPSLELRSHEGRLDHGAQSHAEGRDVRELYYAVRWEFAPGDQFLRLSVPARKGDLSTEPSRMQKAETWESVLLSALALLQSSGTAAEMYERAMAAAAAACLLSLDMYARGGDVLLLFPRGLLPPAPNQLDAAGAWSLTYHPIGCKCSKTGKCDHTAIVGTTHPDRALLKRVCQRLSDASRNDLLSFGMSPSRGIACHHLGRQMAGLPASYPHGMVVRASMLSCNEHLTHPTWH